VRRRVSAIAAVTALLALGSVAVPATSTAAAGSYGVASHQGAPHVTVTVDGEGHVRMPARLRAGRYTFAVKGVDVTSLQLARPVRGYTRAEFIRDYNAAQLGRRVATFTRMGRLAGGVFAIGSAASFTTTLHPGTYFAFTDNGHLRTADVHAITVTGKDRATAFPQVTGIVRVGDTGFTAPRTMRRSGELLVRNTGTRNHQMGLLPLAPGQSLADLRDTFPTMDAQSAGRAQADIAAADESGFALSGAVGPDTSYVWAYHLPAGRYALVDVALDSRGVPGFLASHRMRAVRLK
jgi:hypothetical protein